MTRSIHTTTIDTATIDTDRLDAVRLRARELAEGEWTVAEAVADQGPAAVSTPAVTAAQDAVTAGFTDDLGAILDIGLVAQDDPAEQSPGLTADERAQLEEQAAVRGVDGTSLTDAELVDFVADAQTTGIEHGFVPTASALDAAATAALFGGDFALETEAGTIDSGNVTIYDAAGRPVTEIEAGAQADPAAIGQAVLDQSAQTQGTEVDGYLAQGYTVIGYGDDGSVLLQSPDGGQVRVHENGNTTVERSDPGSAPAPDDDAPPADDTQPAGEGDDDDGDDEPAAPDAPAEEAAPPPPPPAEDTAPDPDAAAAGTPTPDDVATNPAAREAFYDSPLFGHGSGGPGIKTGGIPDDPEGTEENPAARTQFEDSPLGGGRDGGLDTTNGTGPAREDFEFGSGRHTIDPRDLDAVDLAANGGGAAGPETGDGVGDPLAGADVPVIGPPPIVGGGTHDGDADVTGGIAGPVRAADVSFDDVAIDTSRLDVAFA
ncbi:MAG: hypothetical protein ACT4RN_14810 [Pseudonocardia sp.]